MCAFQDYFEKLIFQKKKENPSSSTSSYHRHSCKAISPSAGLLSYQVSWACPENFNCYSISYCYFIYC